MSAKEIIISSVDSERIRKKIMDERAKTGYLSKELKLLLDELNRAKVLKPEEIPSDVLTMHSRVRLHYVSNGKSLEIQIVYPEEANVQEGKVSIFAPIATALLGYKKGDVVDWPVHNNIMKVKIDEIIYQPEAEGNYQL